MKKIFIMSLGLLFSCAAVGPPPTLPNEKEFEVPSVLADKFSVKEAGPIPVTAKNEVPVVSVSDGPKGPKIKKSKKEMKTTKPNTWPNRWTMDPFFHAGERYVFDVTYFGATAGELDLQLLPPKMLADRNSYHIRAIAKTASVFALFYRMNDVAESFMDSAGLFSHKFSLKLDESLQQRDVLELFDQKANVVHYWSKLDHKKKGKHQDQMVIPTKPFVQDGLSAFFYLRTFPFKDGDVYDFPVVSNGKLRDVRVTVVRREKLKTKIGEFPAVVLRPEVVLDGVLKTYGDSFVWISDDPRRLLLKVDAKIKVGSVIAYLREYSNGTAPAQEIR